MKKTTTTLILLLFFCFNSFSQSTNVQIYNEKEIDNYLTNPTVLASNEYEILLDIKYGSDEILNEEVLEMLALGEVKEINLFYSDFPKNNDFNHLNEKRINKLKSKMGSMISDSVTWNVVRQIGCKNRKEAMELFHGFEIIMEFNTGIKLAALEIDSSFEDFVVEKVLGRNDWREMLIVTDVTGSMSPYINQLFLWLKLNTIDGRVKQFLFFNDGNSTPDNQKVVGYTGGIYHTKSKKYNSVEQIAIISMMGGNGGDLEENDIESLLKGIDLCPNCKENILIADNNSPMRDLSLIKELKKTIRVIVCGSSGKINAEYLNLARQTNGSIHLMEEDLFNLVKFNEGEKLDIYGVEYVIKNNRFVEVKQM